MNSGGFDISSLTKNSPGNRNTPPTPFGNVPGAMQGLPVNHNLLMPNAVPGQHLVNPLVTGVPVVGPSAGHHQAISMASAATNSLASSLNLSSIHPLANILHELPLPSKTLTQGKKQECLLNEVQDQVHANSNLHQELGHQHQLSLQLSQQLHVSKQHINTLPLNWNANFQPGRTASNNQPQQFSQNHQQNSYVLSLLQKSDVFHNNVILPPVSHQTPSQSQAQQPRTQRSSQYWSPWSEQGQQTPQQPQSQSQQQVPSPFVASPTPAVPNQQAYPRQSNSFSQANSQQSNENSNSCSSFVDAVPVQVTPTDSLSNASGSHTQSEVHKQRYDNHQPPRTPNETHPSPHYLQSPVHTAPTTPQQLQNQHHNQPEIATNHIQESQHNQAQETYTTSDLKALQAFAEPVIKLDKIDMTQYYADNFSSLGDRVKSNKRTRIPDSPASKKSKKDKSHHQKEARSDSSKKHSSSNDKSDRCASPPSKKLSKNSTPTKYSSDSQYSSAHSMSSSSEPQLVSQNSSLPAFDKFEAMLDELFDLGKMQNDKSRKSDSSSSTEDEDHSDSESERKKKKKSNKLNGDIRDDGHSKLFDITVNGGTLAHFVALTAKLKRNNQMTNVPASKLINLMNVLTQQLAVQSSYLKDKRRRSTEENEDDDDDTNLANSASMMQKFESCCDCSCIALYVMSSKGMSSRVYLEECIEQIVAFLNTTIQQYTTIGAAQYSSPSKQTKKSPKKSNNYISPTSGANKKILAKMYTKWSELVGLIVEMLTHRQGSLTDTLVLSCTRLAFGAFFLESLSSSSNSVLSASNSNEIQLNALKLTTTIFSQYTNHQAVILEELLQSIARLPTTKKGRVTYKVDGDEGSVGSSISMFSALFLQLIQSLFKEKEKPENKEKADDKAGGDKALSVKQQLAQTLKAQYNAALQVTASFLNSFIKKCFGIGAQQTSSDSDLRVLFEGLVGDLMVTLHKPSWPAAQLMVQVLVKILMQNIVDRAKPVKGSGGGQAQLNLKLASIDHLGTIVSRLSKELADLDQVKADVKSSLNRILNGDNDSEKTDNADSDEDTSSKKSKKKPKKSNKCTVDLSDDKLEKEIWKHLIRFCDEERLSCEKNSFVSMWIKEKEREAEIAQKQDTEATMDKNGLVELSPMDKCEQKIKQFITLYRRASKQNAEDDEYHVIDSKTAESIIRLIDLSQHTTIRIFEVAMSHVVASLSTSNTTMRSRAMKSLSAILNNAEKRDAAKLLSRIDVQRAIKNALLDQSTSVREATIDLIGKFILNGGSEELIDQYFEIFTGRLRDTGVSVRKRVIKVLKEICLNYPSYKRIPEICAKIIQCVNDDGEGIRKLVTETITTMWFKAEKNRDATRLKVNCINHVVATVISERIGTEWLQQLLTNLFAKDGDKKKPGEDDEDEKPSLSAQQVQQVSTASTQIIDVLIADILCSEEEKRSKNDCLSAMTTIWLFAKVCPQLVMNHIPILHPYLSVRCATQGDLMIVIKVVQILELVLPKLSNPSPDMLVQIEMDLTKNILKNNVQVLPCCVSCLSTLIHKHTNNQNLVQDLFPKLFTMLCQVAQNPACLQYNAQQTRPKFLRALFTCGLFAKHFEFLQHKDQLYEILVKFILVNQTTAEFPEPKDTDILSKALTALGFMFERNPEFSLKQQSQSIYKSMLRYSDKENISYHDITTCQVLRNITSYLSDEFNSEMEKTIEWSKEDLKSMTSEENDSGSLQSRVIQCYLADVLRCTLSPMLAVRRAAVNLIHIIHNGGHVHPLQLVPYLIAMSSDDDTSIRLRADHVLHEIERKYHGFVSMKSKSGVHLSYQLHQHQGRRGFRVENVTQSAAASTSGGSGSTAASSSSSSLPSSSEDRLITGRLSTLYSVVASNRQSRRAFISGLLKYFDMSGGGPSMNDAMVAPSLNPEEPENSDIIQSFVCDNIIWLPYSFWDEPLYILQQLDLNISLLASHIQSQFKDLLNVQSDQDEERLEAEASANAQAEEQHGPMDTLENGDREQEGSEFNADLRAHIPKPMPSILGTIDLVKNLKAFYMLNWSRHLLRELFSINDQKLQDYSPNENQKVWDKPVHRRVVDERILDKLMVYPSVDFDPEKFDSSMRNRLAAEYQRFKDHQLTGVDPNSKTVSQILKEPLPKEPKPGKNKGENSTNSATCEALPQLSREAEEELMMKIKQSECSVVMTDISSMDINALIKQSAVSGDNNHGRPTEAESEAEHNSYASRLQQQQQQQSLKMTISVNSSTKKSKKSKKEKKKKKKKKYRKIESSDESNESESEDDEDFSDDPSYA
ncbi:Nipped-B-like protein [Halotydeus destructor]|nr:Nipped-B-like protein [Halotydeus destructor]